MNSVVVAILSFLFFVLSCKTCQSSSPQIVEVPFVDEDDPGTPLFLTPLIESGKIKEARSKAFVRHHQIDNVESYSGYFTVNKEYNSNLFMWFFPAPAEPHIAPLILWLQGGPAVTSMFGLFVEHGPFIVTAKQTLKLRENSWYLVHNIIYLDSPVGTGYSFTDNENGYARNVTQVARDVLTALIQFFLLFPELQTNDFFVMGESYSGKFVPAVSHAIKNHNIKAETKIELKGLAIGNGFCDPENQLLYSDYLYQIGLIDLNGKAEFQKYEQATREFIKQKNFIKAIENYSKLFGFDENGKSSLFYNLTGFFHFYNYIHENLENNKYYDLFWPFEKWIQSIDARYAIHVGNNTFSIFNVTVYKHLKDDYLHSVVDLLKDLLENGYKVLIYNGQLDIVDPYPLAANYLQKMQWSGAAKYAKTPKKFWIVEHNLAGYTKSADNLTFVLVRNAGHFVPCDQPVWALELITIFTYGLLF